METAHLNIRRKNKSTAKSSLFTFSRFKFNIMKWLVERSRYLPIVSVFGMLIGSLAALYLGVLKTFKVIETAIFNSKESEPTLYVLFEALDCFLVATALIVVAVSLYELFIGGLEVPDWMLVKD